MGFPLICIGGACDGKCIKVTILAFDRGCGSIDMRVPPAEKAYWGGPVTAYVPAQVCTYGIRRLIVNGHELPFLVSRDITDKVAADMARTHLASMACGKRGHKWHVWRRSPRK